MSKSQVQPGVGTLQEALNRAPDGSELVLADGTYRGSGSHLLTITKSITIRAEHPGRAVLDGEEARCVVQISKHKHRRVVLDGQNNGNGHLPDRWHAHPQQLRHPASFATTKPMRRMRRVAPSLPWAVPRSSSANLCRIHSNVVHNGRYNQGAGIWLMDSALTMSGSTLHDNKADQGAALFIHKSTATLDKGCHVDGSIHGQYTSVDAIADVTADVIADVISDEDVGLW